jgi:hypothetical protein
MSGTSSSTSSSTSSQKQQENNAMEYYKTLLIQLDLTKNKLYLKTVEQQILAFFYSSKLYF